MCNLTETKKKPIFSIKEKNEIRKMIIDKLQQCELIVANEGISGAYTTYDKEPLTLKRIYWSKISHIYDPTISGGEVCTILFKFSPKISHGDIGKLNLDLISLRRDLKINDLGL